MFIDLYSIPVFSQPLSTHAEVKEDFSSVINDDSNFNKYPSWYCNVDTTFGLPESSKLPFHNFIKGAVSGLNSYLGKLGVDSNVAYGVECWLNRYSKNQHQELHNHAGESVISCAYMLKLPPDSGRFVFYRNTYDFFHNSTLPGLSSEPFRYNNRVTPPLREGDIVFFPSVLEHYVTVNESDNIRATISANFVIKERNNEEKSD
tara:strand:+ start:1880 stop:2491 length:612 start_codon:yes stop_codon:yes gene_type:complete